MYFTLSDLLTYSHPLPVSTYLAAVIMRALGATLLAVRLKLSLFV